MKVFRLRINGFELEWDRAYGAFRRGGWSICVRGTYLAQLEPWLIVASVKAWRRWRNWEPQQ